MSGDFIRWKDEVHVTPYIEADAAEQAKVAKMFDEAAALEQIENRGLNNG